MLTDKWGDESAPSRLCGPRLSADSRAMSLSSLARQHRLNCCAGGRKCVSSQITAADGGVCLCGCRCCSHFQLLCRGPLVCHEWSTGVPQELGVRSYRRCVLKNGDRGIEILRQSTEITSTPEKRAHDPSAAEELECRCWGRS